MFQCSRFYDPKCYDCIIVIVCTDLITFFGLLMSVWNHSELIILITREKQRRRENEHVSGTSFSNYLKVESNELSEQIFGFWEQIFVQARGIKLLFSVILLISDLSMMHYFFSCAFLRLLEFSDMQLKCLLKYAPMTTISILSNFLSNHFVALKTSLSFCKYASYIWLNCFTMKRFFFKKADH